MTAPAAPGARCHRLGILASGIGVAPAIAINSALAFLTIAPAAIALARLGPRRETAAA